MVKNIIIASLLVLACFLLIEEYRIYILQEELEKVVISEKLLQFENNVLNQKVNELFIENEYSKKLKKDLDSCRSENYRNEQKLQLIHGIYEK